MTQKTGKIVVRSIIVVMTAVLLLLIYFLHPGVLIIPHNPITPDGRIFIYRDRPRDVPIFIIPEFCETTPDGKVIMYNSIKELDEVADRIIIRIENINLFFDRYWNCLYPEN